MKSAPKLKDSKLLTIKFQSTLSNAFSKSIKNNIPFLLLEEQKLIRSKTSRIFSPMKRPFMKPDWLELIILGKQGWILEASALEQIL